MANASAGGLTYKFNVDIADMQAKLADVDKGLSQIADKAKTSGDRMSEGFTKASDAGSKLSVTTIAIGTAIGTYLGNKINDILSRIPSLFTDARDAAAGFAKTSEDLRLPVDMILALHHAGTQAGVSVSEMDDALKHFTEQTKKTVGDAGDFYKALSNIDPAFAKGVQGAHSQADALKFVIDAFGKATTEVQKAQLADQAFGTDSERLSNMFVRGRASLDDYAEAARKAGVILDQGLARQAEEAKAKSEAFAMVIQNYLTRAFVQLIPVIDQVMQRLPAFIDLASRAISAWTNDPKFLTDTALDKELAVQKAKVDKIPNYVLSADDDQGSKWMKGPTDDEQQTRSDYEALVEEKQRRDAQKAEFDKAEKEREARMTRFMPRPGLGGKSDDGKDKVDPAQAYINTIEREVHAMEQEAATFNLSAQAQREAIDLQKLDDLGKQRSIDVTEAMRAKVKAFADDQVQLQRKLTQLQGTKDLWRDFGTGVANALDQIALKGGNVRDVLRNLLETISSQAFMGFLTGSGPFGAALGLANPGGGLGGIFGLIGKGLGLPGMAGGGTVQAGQAIRVGEHGEERFIPGAPGTIVPNDQVENARAPGAGGRSMSGGITVTNHFHVTTPDAPSFVRSEQQITGMLSRAVSRGARGA